uniref:Uncharacterized protein n=1 Tax=Aegilops tauschii subsp. strangulata TaxID=200361 RepID=A0A453I496_AEGTS
MACSSASPSKGDRFVFVAPSCSGQGRFMPAIVFRRLLLRKSLFRLQVVEPVQVYSMNEHQVRSINLLLWSVQGNIHFINQINLLLGVVIIF